MHMCEQLEELAWIPLMSVSGHLYDQCHKG